jgi:hypothetical protein
MAMVEAVRTVASPAAIWAIVVVAVACLAFWLVAVSVADSHPRIRHRQIPDMPGPVLGGMHVAEGGRSVSPNRDAPAVFTEPLSGVPAQRSGEPEPAGASAAAEQSATAAGPAATAGRDIPARRSGEADRPEHSATGATGASGGAGAAGADRGGTAG